MLRRWCRALVPGGQHRVRLRRWLVRILLFATVAPVAALLLGYLVVELPPRRPDSAAEASVLAFADAAQPELGRAGVTDRRSVPLARVPLHLRHAVLAAENRGFYQEFAIDPAGILRAVLANLTGDSQQGASTITQQYVKNVYLSSERSYARKFRELILAVKVERSTSKDEILGGYLNTIYFGRGAYGVDAAARAYFGQPVDRLTVAQAALLAAVIKSPSAFDPAADPQVRSRVEARWRYVLEGMTASGWLPAEEARRLVFPMPRPPASRANGARDHLELLAIAELHRLGFSEREIATGGLRVRTTIRAGAQQAVETAARTALWNRLDQTGKTRPADRDVRAAVVALDARDGAVRALYGGRDYTRRQLNDATQASVALGPMARPVLLAAGSRSGVPVDTRPATVRAAFAAGDQGYFVRLAQSVGADQVRDTLVQAGLPATTPGLDSWISLLHTELSVRPIEVARTLATLAGSGRSFRPYLIAEVRSARGQLLYRASPRSDGALPPQAAAAATGALPSRDCPGGSGTGLSGFSGAAVQDSAGWDALVQGETVAVSVLFRDAPGLGHRPADRALTGVAGQRRFDPAQLLVPLTCGALR